MNFTEYQKFTKENFSYPGYSSKQGRELEVARLQDTVKDLVAEMSIEPAPFVADNVKILLGDLLWYVADIANYKELNVEEILADKVCGMLTEGKL